MTNKELEDIAEKYNPVIRGWLNYYGKYGRRELAKVLNTINVHLCFLVMRKYKKYKHKRQKVRKYLKMLSTKFRCLFNHWKVGILLKTG